MCGTTVASVRKVVLNTEEEPGQAAEPIIAAITFPFACVGRVGINGALCSSFRHIHGNPAEEQDLFGGRGQGEVFVREMSECLDERNQKLSWYNK